MADDPDRRSVPSAVPATAAAAAAKHDPPEPPARCSRCKRVLSPVSSYPPFLYLSRIPSCSRAPRRSWPATCGLSLCPFLFVPRFPPHQDFTCSFCFNNSRCQVTAVSVLSFRFAYLSIPKFVSSLYHNLTSWPDQSHPPASPPKRKKKTSSLGAWPWFFSLSLSAGI